MWLKDTLQGTPMLGNPWAALFTAQASRILVTNKGAHLSNTEIFSFVHHDHSRPTPAIKVLYGAKTQSASLGSQLIHMA